jgi:uncharacterized caspase-like protein
MKFRRLILLCFSFFLSFGTFPAESTVKTYQWEDYTKPFETRIAISSGETKSVRVELPAAVADADEVQLFVSTAASGPWSYNTRIQLTINAKPINQFTTGPDFKLDIKKGYLKTGANIFTFDCVGPADYFNIYELKFGLPNALADMTPPRPSPAKREETTAPPKPEIVKSPVASAPTTAGVVKADKAEPNVVPEKTTPSQPKPVPAIDDTGQRWAVVIGVSAYEDSRIPSLRYAARDAQAFYDWLVSPEGGRYAPSKVKLLLEKNATNERIKDALFNWLKQAIEEDVVVIYFAGHGSPESPDATQNLYLLPYNTRYDNIAVTGFPMWDIETALTRFIKAKRVVIVADACHAGGVGLAFDIAVRAGRGLQVNQINSSLQSLTEIGEGVCVISASRDKEFSQEGRQWGGGHGVFTYYLIEGLKGAADYDKSGSVSIGEVTVYVSQQVRRATRNAQNPIVAGRFDPSLVIGK